MLLCNGCGAPILEHGNLYTAMPIFDTKEEALALSIDAYDETGQHPAVAQVIIQPVTQSPPCPQ